MVKTIKALSILLVIMSVVILGTAQGFTSPLQDSMALKVVKSHYVEDSSEVYFPEVRGMENTNLQATINTNLKTAILALTNSSPNSSLYGDFEVVFYNKNLLGIHFMGYSFTKGTAHPNKIDCGIHIDLTTGKTYKIEDLFKEGIDFESSIKERCLRHADTYRLKVKEVWDGWLHEDFVSSWTGEDRGFLLLAKSIRVYTIPRYVTGAIGGYTIPYSDLMDIINTEGELWKKIQSQAPRTIEVVPNTPNNVEAINNRHTTIVDKNQVKVGDVIAGLTVISLDHSAKLVKVLEVQEIL